MCLFHLQLLRQVFCGANPDNGFPVHQGTASLQNNTHATSGLALGQRKLPDFIPNVHIMLAALLSVRFSVFFPIQISVIQKRSLDIYKFHLYLLFDYWKRGPSASRANAQAERRKKKSPNVTCNTFCVCGWKDELKVPKFLQSHIAELQLYTEMHCSSNKPRFYCSSRFASC